MSGQLELPGGGGDLEALQKQEVEALVTGLENTASASYLRKDAPDTAVGPIDFTGKTTHASGLKVTGGGVDNTPSGVYNSSNGFIALTANKWTDESTVEEGGSALSTW